MGYATASIANAEDYQRALSTSQPVFLLFVSSHCPACSNAAPLFESVAGQYPTAVSLILDCTKTPRHPEVTGTPTLLIYLDGALQEKHKGFGPGPDQAPYVEALFTRYAARTGAKPPASPAAPPRPQPSCASLHAPGYRPPPAGDPAGSSPNRPGSGNPRSRQP